MKEEEKNMKRFTTLNLLVLLAISLGISGCIGYQAFPLAARTGDTISLALGGTSQHETAPGSQITLNDLNVTIQQDINGNGTIESSETFTVKKRYLFRLYPDPTSGAANNPDGMYMDPVGVWSAVLDLTYPGTTTALPLVAGLPAKLVVTSNGKLKDTVWGPSSEGVLSNIPINILPGTGSSHNFNNASPFIAAKMTQLNPLPQVAIGFSGGQNIAAADLAIDYDQTVLIPDGDIPNYGFKIIGDVTNSHVILNKRDYRDLSGNGKMRILLMMNEGTAPADSLKCFIVWNKASIDKPSGKVVTTNTFTVTNAKFYDETGAPVIGVSVVKTLLYQ